MKNYSSQVVNLQISTEQAFDFLSDFRHFQKVLPSEITGWEADSDSCSFDAPMIGRVSFAYGQKIPNSLLTVIPSGDLPLKFSITCKLLAKGESHNAQVEVDAEVGGLQEMFLGRILQNIADIMANKLAGLTEDDIKD